MTGRAFRPLVLAVLLVGLVADDGAAQSCSVPSFARTGFSMGGSEEVAFGDFNWDGRQDLVVGGGPTVYVYFGDGAGGFGGPPLMLSTGGSDALAVADFNRDGHPDIAAAASALNGVAVLLASGPGTFAAPVLYPATTASRGLAVADFDSDGRLDIVAAGSDLASSLLLGVGDGTFVGGASISVGGPSDAVVTSDFNRDGHADLVFVNTDLDAVRVLLGDGSGGFGSATPIGVAAAPNSAVVDDFNKDGRPDLAVGSAGVPTVNILLGDGAGGFLPPMNADVGPIGVWRIVSGELDGDGNPDLAVTHRYSGANDSVSVLLGQGTGAFAAPVDFAINADVGQGAAIADINRDGRADMVVAAGGAPEQISVFLNQTGIPCSAASFGPAMRGVVSGYLTGYSSFWTASADFNSDGNADLVVSDITNGLVKLHLGDGRGGLTPTSEVAVGTTPVGLAAGDFDGDGRPDVVSANYDQLSLSVRLGDGSGGLGGGSEINLGTGPFSVVATDLNADARLDLVVSTPDAGAVSVLLGNGDGTFGLPVAIPLAGSMPIGLATGDLNADGRADVVTADFNGAVWTLLGDGGGGLTALRTVAPLARPYFVGIGDFSGDDRPDVVLSYQELGTVSLFPGNGAGGLGAPAQFATLTGTLTYQIGVADLNGDRRPDVVAAGQTSSLISVLLGDGVGGLGAATTFEPGHYPSSFALADFTGDGVTDVATNGSLLVGNGSGGFDMPIRSAGQSTGSGWNLVLADFNRDGMLDLATRTGVSPTNVVAVYAGNGAGGFGAAVNLTAGVNPNVTAADLDGNGTIDLATANSNDDTVSVLLGSGSGTFAAAVTYAAGGTSPASIAASDLDRDGRLDLVVSNGTSNSVSILLGLGGGDFGAATIFALNGSASPGGLAVGDLDRDGTVDVVVARTAAGEDSVSVLLGNGVGGFGSQTVVPVGTVPSQLLLEDLDRDGILDLLVGTNASSPNVSRLFGNGSGGFGAPAAVVVGYRPSAVALADVTGDGKVDLVVTSVAARVVSVLVGDGAGGFSNRTDYKAGSDFPRVAAGDLNRDGKLDLVAPHVTSSGIWTLLNTNCKTRGLRFSRDVPSCNAPSASFASQPVLSVVDDGANVIQCAAGDVTASIMANTGTPGAALGGTTAISPVAGVATYTNLSVDFVGSGYQLLFTHAGARNAWSRRFNVGDPLITGPAGFCQTASAVYDVGAGYDSYAWTLDGDPVLSRLRNVTLSGVSPGLRELMVTVTQAECTDTQTLWLDVAAALSEVEIAMAGASGVCPTCTGGTASVVDTGGGTVTHQWGYRTVSGGAITAITGETGADYVLDGADFTLGAGSYFLVVTSTPTCGSAMVSNEIPVSVYTTVAGDAVVVFTVTSKDEVNTLEWLNPAIGASYAATRIQYNVGSPSCSAPAGPFEGTHLERRVGSADARDTATHSGLTNGTTYCYAAFVEHTGMVFGEGRSTKGRPIDTTTPVKWAYSTGATTMAPPGIGATGVYSASNDLVLHGMVRGLGASAGLWPAAWRPYLLSDASHHRMGIGTTSLVPGASRVAFIGAQDGYVYAVNADTGAQLWQSAPVGDVVATAPVAMFTGYGGIADQVYAGSVNSSPPNSFFALNTVNGAQVGLAFDNGGGATAIGAIVGGGAVDYSLQRVYFTSRAAGSARTLWCLGITAGGLVDDCGWPPQALGDIDAAPTLHNGILYVGNNAGRVYAIEAATGAERWHYDTGDGAVKGFIFPDRNSNRVYFATQGVGVGQPGHVWGLADDGPGSVALAWPSVAISAPSIALFTPGGAHILVGSDTGGRLYQLDLTLAGPGVPPATTSIVLGDGSAAVGSPSYDPYYDCIYVGSEAGVIYAVELPLP